MQCSRSFEYWEIFELAAPREEKSLGSLWIQMPLSPSFWSLSTLPYSSLV